MSISPPVKETFLAHPSPLSSASHLSPHLLTPDSDRFGRRPDLDTLVFTKQPVPRKPSEHHHQSLYSPFTESEASDGHLSEAQHTGGSIPHSPNKAQHLSLLTAILSSPDHAVSKNSLNARTESRRVPSQPLAIITTSSGPSTTMSSPATREPHGILQTTAAPAKVETGPPSSILRRESADDEQTSSTGASLGLGLGVSGIGGMAHEGTIGLDGLAGRLEKVEEKRERIGWADKVGKPTVSLRRRPRRIAAEHQPATAANLARIPSTGSSIGPRPRLHFAVAHPPSHGSTSASEAGDVPRRHSTTTNTSHHPNDPFAKERKVQESLGESDSNLEDEEDSDPDDTPLEEVPRLYGYNSRSTSSSGRRSEDLQSPIEEEDDGEDLGYQEDEEDGMFSDEEETAAFDLPDHLVKGKFAFARPTNYFRGRRPSREDMSPATTPPPAPSFFPPPNRRGRGHVRVADPTLAVAKTEKKACSRHCSPPPSTRSRSGSRVEAAPPAVASPSARFMKRPEATAAQPSKQRIVGSPMPPRNFAKEEDDEEDENDDDVDDSEEEVEAEEAGKTAPPVVRGGWRSDDSIFEGPHARVASRAVKPFEPHGRNLSAPLQQYPVFDEESGDDHSVSASMAREASMDLAPAPRQWIRRASEQAPILRRPSIASALDPRSNGGSSGSRSREMSLTAPMPSQATVPPALDSTPVLGSSISARSDGGLASRLEKTLSAGSDTASSANTSPAPPMSRDTTISSTGSAQPSPRPSTGGKGTGPDSDLASVNRAASMSGRVTFRPSEPPSRNAPPQRAVSTAAHYLASQKERKGVAAVSSSPAPGPIRCPKRCRGQQEDLGWSDEALIQIRRKAGKDTLL